MTFKGFDKDFVAFLEALEKNNKKAWFDANKDRFRASVQDPFLAFMEDLAPKMEKISPHIVVEPKRAGGSMARIYRDTRFSKDKSPYNTHITAIFRHEVGKKLPAPGFYLRIDTKEVVVGTGLWHAEGPAVAAIRDAIVADPKRWKKVRDDKKFRDLYGSLAGESLKRPPRGYDADHEYVEDLKRKDFVGFRNMALRDIQKPGFLAEVDKAYRGSKALMVFLCDAMDLSF